jgi:xylan 1,4-beta-xylosidase
MSGDRLEVESDHAIRLSRILRRGVRQEPDVSALASFDAANKRLCVLVWHYHDDDLPGDDADVTLTLSGLPELATSNAFTVWKGMGSPQEPTAEQYAELVEAGQLKSLGARVVRIENGETTLSFALPRRGVSLLVYVWNQRPQDQP